MLEINKIYHGNNLELFKQIDDKSIDFILTDPPYELNTKERGKGSLDKTSYKYIKKEGVDDNKRITQISSGYDYINTWNEMIRVLKKVNVVIFCSNKQISKTMKFFEDKGYNVTLLVWHKTNAIPFVNNTWKSDLEYIVHIRENGATFRNVNNIKSKIYTSPTEPDKSHPTTKPIALFEKFINICSNEGDLVLDCFSGSGTTAIASLELKRNFICFEINDFYFQKSCERVKNYQDQLQLF